MVVISSSFPTNPYLAGRISTVNCFLDALPFLEFHVHKKILEKLTRSLESTYHSEFTYSYRYSYSYIEIDNLDNHEMIVWLLTAPKYKDMVNEQNDDGMTPLHLAAVQNKIDVANALLKSPYIVMDVLDRSKFTALHLAMLCTYIRILSDDTLTRGVNNNRVL